MGAPHTTCTVSPLVVLTTAIPDALLGVPYLATFAAAGGTPPYTFDEVDPENWPIGVALGDDGAFGGVPQAAGQWDLTFSVSDASDQTVTSTLSFNEQFDRVIGMFDSSQH